MSRHGKRCIAVCYVTDRQDKTPLMTMDFGLTFVLNALKNEYNQEVRIIDFTIYFHEYQTYHFVYLGLYCIVIKLQEHRSAQWCVAS